MSAMQITPFNQSINGDEQVVIFEWLARYFESIFDIKSAKSCLNISESLKAQREG